MRLHVLLPALASAIVLCAQTDDGIPDLIPEVRGYIAEMPSIERALEHAGYTSTEISLLAALRDPRAQVRSMAAVELAKKHDTDAIPRMLDAALAEKAPGTRIWIADALATLGSEKGATVLLGMCKPRDGVDPLHEASLRLIAAGDVLDLGRAACQEDVIDVLRFLGRLGTPSAPEMEGGLVVLALSIADRHSRAFSHNSEEIRDLASRSLLDSRGYVRMAASNTLGVFGDAASALTLERAASAERDDTVRTRMLANLKLLQGSDR